MERRQFLSLAISAPIVAAVPGLSTPGKYGLMTIERHRLLRARGITLRVLWDGMDVTNKCRLADDIEGFAECLKENENGKSYIDWYTKDVAQHTLRGNIQFVRVDL